jgi:hypothetical protein
MHICAFGRELMATLAVGRGPIVVSTVAKFVLDIFLLRPPSEVAQAVVSRVTVQVSRHQPEGAGSDESSQHGHMYCNDGRNVVATDSNA